MPGLVSFRRTVLTAARVERRMPGIDAAIGRFADGGIWLGFVVAVLLGLRHATDPDHLAAVYTLVLGDAEAGARRAGLLGLAWGVGHAATLAAFGLPVVLFRRYLPSAAQAAAETLVGILIAGLAVRLLRRWRRAELHSHPHRHGALEHTHPHTHDHPQSGRADARTTARAAHGHAHRDTLGRSPATAFGIGLVHGVGGSAAVGVLLIGALPSRASSAAALLLFAAATAVSMAAVSWSAGRLLAERPVVPRLSAVPPLLGVASLLFGVWYAVGGLRSLAASL
jgi:ABC-type nickel/cobalt efflux system permease component RcnA